MTWRDALFMLAGAGSMAALWLAARCFDGFLQTVPYWRMVRDIKFLRAQLTEARHQRGKKLT